jgi:hypothetical protein
MYFVSRSQTEGAVIPAPGALVFTVSLRATPKTVISENPIGIVSDARGRHAIRF